MGWVPAEVRRACAEMRTVLGWSVSQSAKWCREVAEELDVVPAESFLIERQSKPKISVNAVCEADLIGMIVETGIHIRTRCGEVQCK